MWISLTIKLVKLNFEHDRLYINIEVLLIWCIQSMHIQ